MIRTSSRCPLFPYTTLFRSRIRLAAAADVADAASECVVSPEHLLGERAIDENPVRARDGVFQFQLAPCQKTEDRKSTRLNSSHLVISYAVFCLKKKIINTTS